MFNPQFAVFLRQIGTCLYAPSYVFVILEVFAGHWSLRSWLEECWCLRVLAEQRVLESIEILWWMKACTKQCVFVMWFHSNVSLSFPSILTLAVIKNCSTHWSFDDICGNLIVSSCWFWIFPLEAFSKYWYINKWDS